MLYAKGTFSGEYESVGRVEDAGILAAHEFAVPSKGNGIFHERMAEYIARDERLMSLPKKLNKFVAAALLELEPGIQVSIFGGESSGVAGGGEGTKGEVRQLRDYIISEFGTVVPSIHIGHANHIGRIAAQARAQKLKPIILSGYPNGFDPASTQPHVRSAARWNLHELIGVPYLHLTHQF